MIQPPLHTAHAGHSVHARLQAAQTLVITHPRRRQRPGRPARGAPTLATFTADYTVLRRHTADHGAGIIGAQSV